MRLTAVDIFSKDNLDLLEEYNIEKSDVLIIKNEDKFLNDFNFTINIRINENEAFSNSITIFFDSLNYQEELNDFITDHISDFCMKYRTVEYLLSLEPHMIECSMDLVNSLSSSDKRKILPLLL